MKKKIMYLFFTVFLVSIFVGKVNAKDKFVCYYDDKGYITNEDGVALTSSEKAGMRFYNCKDNNTMSMANTYIKITVDENYNAEVLFYDAKNKIETTEICHWLDSSGYGYPMKYKIDQDSGNQLQSSDFEFGCPRSIDRLTLSSVTNTIDDPNTGGTTTLTILPFDFNILKSGTSHYKMMYETDANSDWGKQLSVTPCYDPSNLSNSAKNINYCERIPKKVLSNTVEEYDTDKYISCNYVGTKEAADEGTYTQVSFKFNKEDGKYVSGSGFCEYSVAGGAAKATFDLTVSDGKYICPNEVYDCSDSEDGTSFTNVSCSGGKSYSLIKSFKKTENGNISGCDMFSGLGKYIESAYTLIRYLIPTLIVVLSTADFVGVVFSGEAEKLEKAKNKFINRLIIGVVALLIPFFLELLLKIAGIIGSNESLADVACNWFG